MKKTPKYVKFNFAKMFKAKGFTILSDKRFYLDKEGNEITDEFIYNKFNGNVPDSIDNAKSVWSFSLIVKPQQYEVVDWFIKEHGILIKADCDCYGEIWFAKISVCSKATWENLELRSKITNANHFLEETNSLEKAYDIAFEYILKNIL